MSMETQYIEVIFCSPLLVSSIALSLSLPLSLVSWFSLSTGVLRLFVALCLQVSWEWRLGARQLKKSLRFHLKRSDSTLTFSVFSMECLAEKVPSSSTSPWLVKGLLSFPSPRSEIDSILLLSVHGTHRSAFQYYNTLKPSKEETNHHKLLSCFILFIYSKNTVA